MSRNQMVSAAYSATDGGSVTQRVTYVYDALSNRIERQGWDGSTTTTTRYALDGWDSAKPSPIGNEHFDVWAELDGTSALVLRRVTGPGFDEHVARQSAAGAVEWYAADHLGSVRLILDNSGTPTATLAYDAFGNSLTGTVTDHGYAGYRLDSLTGLYSVRAREYGPGTATWYSEDPEGLRPDANLYRYVGNSVTNATDPSGQELIAVGSEALKEALWHLENTYGLNRATDIQVIDLGRAGSGIWENSGKDNLYFIGPRPGRGMLEYQAPRIPREADAAIRDMWVAFWNPEVRRFVGEIGEGQTPPGGGAWPGLFHSRPWSGGAQFYVGTQFPLDLLSDGQRTMIDATYASQITGDISIVSPAKLQAMEIDGQAQKVGGYYYVAWIDPSTKRTHQVVFEPFRSMKECVGGGAVGAYASPSFVDVTKSVVGKDIQAGDYYKAVRYAFSDIRGGVAELKAAFERINSPEAARRQIEAVTASKEGKRIDSYIAGADTTLKGLQLAARITPILGTTIEGIEGNTEGAILSGLGDFGLLVGFGAADKLRRIGQLSRAWRISVGVATGAELAAAGYNVGQGIRDIHSGEYWQATANFGSAGLRLLGITPGVLA